MARDQSGGVTLSSDEEAARKRVGRKQLAEDGCPQDYPPDRKPQTQGNDRPTGVVSEDWETGAVDPLHKR